MDFDVKTYGGAVGDGVANDTAAIQKTINDAAAYLAAGGSPGPITFPGSRGPYLVSSLVFPSVSKGWLTSIFDNALLANSISIGSNNAYIGRGSNGVGAGTLFPYGPKSVWFRRGRHPGAFVDMNGVYGAYFEGIQMQQQYATTPTLHIHDNKGIGCVQNMFVRCSIRGSSRPIVIDPSAPNVTVGFNLKFLDSVIDSTGNGPALSITNMGGITVQGGYLRSAQINWQNVPNMDWFVFRDLLSESLNNYPFLTLNGGYNIILEGIALADTAGTVYLVKKIPGTYPAYLKVRDCAFNSGACLVDPSSEPNKLNGTIESCGAKATYNQAKQCFQWGRFEEPGGPTIHYGSKTFVKYSGQPVQLATQ